MTNREDNGEAPDAARAKLAVPSPPNTIAADFSRTGIQPQDKLLKLMNLQFKKARGRALQHSRRAKNYRCCTRFDHIGACARWRGFAVIDRQMETGSDVEEETLELLKELTTTSGNFYRRLGGVEDSVTADEITSAEAEFLQGIFFYAGLNPLNCEGVFTQNRRDRQNTRRGLT